MTNRSICAWCDPGKPGNHTICERHAAELRAECERFERPVDAGWWEHAERAGKRYDQVVLSLVVLAGIALLGVVVGAGWAIWEASEALR